MGRLGVGRAFSGPTVASFKPHRGYCNEEVESTYAHVRDEDVGAQRLNDVAEDKQQGSEMHDVVQMVPARLFCSVCAGTIHCAALV